MKTIPLPVVMDNPGILIWDYGIRGHLALRFHRYGMNNQTETLVAGNDWYEFNSTFDLSNLGVSNAQSHFSDEQWSSAFTVVGNHWTRSLVAQLSLYHAIQNKG